MVTRCHHFSHSMPETLNTHNVNSYFTNQTYQTTQIRGHTHNNAPFRTMNMSQKQQGLYHNGSSKSDSSLYATFPCQYYNHALHNSTITANCHETIPFAQARGTIYEGSLLLTVMIEQIIIQAALSSIETSGGTKSKFKAQTELIENAAQVFGQHTLHIAFSKMTGSPLSLTNRLKAPSSYHMSMELKRELSMQYSSFPFDSHAMEAFAQLEQGLHELLYMFCTAQVSLC